MIVLFSQIIECKIETKLFAFSRAKDRLFTLTSVTTQELVDVSELVPKKVLTHLKTYIPLIVV